jgi:hypothetical protein
VTVAVVAGPSPGLTGYVSEAGIAGSSYAWAYRLGVFTLAAGLLLLAAALPRELRAATALLAAAAGATLLSGAVGCSAGCPLPPFESSTTADLVHGAASVAAVACAVLAMLALAAPPLPAPLARAATRAGTTARRTAVALGRLPDPGPALRPLARVAVATALPLSALVGMAMPLLGRGTVVGLLERLVLLVVVLWVVATSIVLIRRARWRRCRPAGSRTGRRPGGPARCSR